MRNPYLLVAVDRLRPTTTTNRVYAYLGSRGATHVVAGGEVVVGRVSVTVYDTF